MDNNKIQKIFHYIIVLWLVILWAIMMFCPEHIDTMILKYFFLFHLLVAEFTLSVERNTFLCKQSVKQKNMFLSF